VKAVNLGCGNDYRERDEERDTDWTNIDRLPQVRADVHFDLDRKHWPLESDTYDLALASHILEHVKEPYSFMGEIWRICKPGATVWIPVPWWNSHAAWCDPDHRRAVQWVAFSFFTRSHYWRQEELSVCTPINIDYDYEIMGYYVTVAKHKKHLEEELCKLNTQQLLEYGDNHPGTLDILIPEMVVIKPTRTKDGWLRDQAELEHKQEPSQVPRAVLLASDTTNPA
jgi:SAM-dependent methyltransferase